MFPFPSLNGHTVADGDRIEVGGSLGGVQVVSLSERAGIHSRVLTAGRPPAPPAQPTPAAKFAPGTLPPQSQYQTSSEDKALLFSISRTVKEGGSRASSEYRLFSCTDAFCFVAVVFPQVPARRHRCRRSPASRAPGVFWRYQCRCAWLASGTLTLRRSSASYVTAWLSSSSTWPTWLAPSAPRPLTWL